MYMLFNCVFRHICSVSIFIDYFISNYHYLKIGQMCKEILPLKIEFFFRLKRFVRCFIRCIEQIQCVSTVLVGLQRIFCKCQMVARKLATFHMKSLPFFDAPIFRSIHYRDLWAATIIGHCNELPHHRICRTHFVGKHCMANFARQSKCFAYYLFVQTTISNIDDSKSSVWF